MDKKKVKVWYEEHKDGISSGMMQIGWSLFIFGLGYVSGVKILESKIRKEIGIAYIKD